MRETETVDYERFEDMAAALRQLLTLVENAHYPPPHEQADAFDAMAQARAALGDQP